MSEHREGVNPGFLTKHKLSLNGVNRAGGEAIVAEIDALPGVDSVLLNEQKQTLKIAYDASHHNIDEMIDIITKHGAALSDSWWSRTRLGWQRLTDQNIKDNSTHVAHCCSKPPVTGNKH